MSALAENIQTQMPEPIVFTDSAAAKVADLIFDIPTLICSISAGITLIPGDIIATGTPVGVGIGFDPPIFLGSGDVVSITIDPIGTLENPVV